MMDEAREEREELAALRADVDDLRREQEAEQPLLAGRGPVGPKQWQAIIAAKLGPCRVCDDPGSNGRMYGRVQLHHVVPRGLGGDDVADNIAPLCPDCHSRVTGCDPEACRALCASLSDGEYAYLIDKCGEDAATRVYGVTYGR